MATNTETQVQRPHQRSRPRTSIPSDVRVSVGVPVIDRPDALERCLESMPSFIDRVIVADNGPEATLDDRRRVYDQPWPFDLDVRQLAYDVGIGRCRATIAEAMAEDYLLVIDSDMVLPPADDLARLWATLDSRPSLGGVSGVLVEEGRFRTGGTNFHEESLFGGKQAIVQGLREDPDLEWVRTDTGRVPIVYFDKLTNAALLRREALEDYSWDADLPDMEHLDFYVGHWRETDWKFAACPAVVFDHQKSRDQDYREEYRDGDRHERKRARGRDRVREKWGYDRVVVGERLEWCDSRRRSLAETGFETLRRVLPTRCTVPIKDLASRLGVDA